MIDIRVHDASVPPALKQAVIDYARRIGAPLGWVEEVLADSRRRLAFLGRDQPDDSPAWLSASPQRGIGGPSAAPNA